MTVKNIFEFLNDRFPVSNACDFDNVGLLVGDGNASVSKALIALDCTLETVEKSKECGCELIITHHPVIFSPIKAVTKGGIVFELLANGIAVISMHTNLDVAVGGVNSCLCETIGLGDIEIHTASDGYALQCGKVSPISPKDFARHLKEKLGGRIKYVCGKKPITNVLVCSGSGGNFIGDAINGGFDALVTADVKHNHFLEASQNGISLYDAGHFETEDIVIEPLSQILISQFPQISFTTFHNSPIKYE